MGLIPSDCGTHLRVAENHSSKRARMVQVSIGIGALLLGVMVYLVDRSPGSVYFIPAWLSISGKVDHVFGYIGNYLPAFVHPFAFILLTAALLEQTKHQLLLICMGWCVVDSLFEIAQMPTVAHRLVAYIPAFDGIPILENTRNYFLYGTFDVLDMISIVTGTIAAYLVVIFSGSKQ